MAQPFTKRLPAPLSVALACFAIFGLCCIVPPSVWLARIAPDGSLNAGTRGFLDGLRTVVLGAGLVALASAVRPDLRSALGAAVSAPAQVLATRPSQWALAWAVITLTSRLAAAAFSDLGLGDDGARVFWLEEWRQDPHAIWSGLWVPGHLYMHALVGLVVRDAAWAGVVLSALAASGTVWILTRAVERDWGRSAAACAGGAIAFQPVALAYGANPDVNPVFAFGIVAAVGALDRARRTSHWWWFVAAWMSASLAAWSRMESLFLLPLLALPLWPRRRAMLAFVAASFVAPVAWYAADFLATGRTANVVHVMQDDPSLSTPIPAAIFSFLGAVWQGVTLPWIVLGVAGMIRALRAGVGRAWIPLALMHVAALGGAALVLGAGLQARYLLLPAAICGAYSGVALGGMFESSRRWAAGLAAVSVGLVLVAPSMFPGRDDLWVRRSPRLRALVDEVAQAAQGGDVVWISDESAYFYAVRTHTPVERYHAISRADADPAQLLVRLRTADTAVACVQVTKHPLAQWDTFRQQAADTWNIESIVVRPDYHLYRLRRIPTS